MSYSVKFGLLPATSLPQANLHKIALGIPKGLALWQGGERKMGFREGRTVKLGFAHLIRSSVRYKFATGKLA